MAQAKSVDTVLVHYTGKSGDGNVFETSVDRGPLQLTIGENKIFSAREVWGH